MDKILKMRFMLRKPILKIGDEAKILFGPAS